MADLDAQGFATLMGTGVAVPPMNAYTVETGGLGAPTMELLDGFGGAKTLSGVRVNSRTAMGYPAFFRGVKLIADTVAKLPLIVRKVEDDGGDHADKQHPAYRLLRRKPNQFTVARVFKSTLTAHAQIHGNGYAYILRDGRANPLELTILDPVGTYPIRWIPSDTNVPEIHYATTTVDGEMFIVPESDVLHIRHLSEDGLLGISIIDRMKEAIGMGIAVRSFGSRFFENGANISGVLQIPNTVRADAQRNILKLWKEQTQGMANSHKVAITTNGTSFQKLSVSPEEAQFLETKRFEIIEVANILGLPPHKLGDNSRQAYNSIEAENRNALDESYGPWLSTWEEECESKLLTQQQQDEETHRIVFDRSAMLIPTLTERAAASRIYSEIGVFTVNDILRREGMETIGPEGDVRHVPVNWKQLGANSNDEISNRLDTILNRLQRIEENANRTA